MNSIRNLSLLGLGVDDDVQPHDRYPALTPGNHLRWAFAHYRGFPRNGYYVYRREHRGPRGEPILLTDAVPEKVRRRGVLETFSPPDDEEGEVTWKFSDSSGYVFRDGYDLNADRTFGPGQDGNWEFVLAAREPQTITLPETAHRVEVSLAVEGRHPTMVTAFADERAVATERVWDSGVVTLEADHITKIRIVGVETSLVEIACFSLAAEATSGWSLLGDAPTPVALPISHPDYPADLGPEDLTAARETARDRVEYGDPERFAPDPTPVASGGTASVEDGSAVVTGQDTDWTADLAGSVFALTGEDTGYVVAEVLDSDRLVLGRTYEGSSASNADYELTDDPFGQLHDYLAHLVDDGPSAGGMANRVAPEPVHEEGTITRFEHDRRVEGSGTNWTDDFEGLTLRAARDVGGTATVMHGAAVAMSTTADWNDRLVGDRFRIAGEREFYTITDVRSFAYQGTTVSILSFDRPVSGPHYPGQGLDYDIFEADGVEVTDVLGSEKLLTAHPHPGPDDGIDRNYVLAPSLSAEVPAEVGANAPSTPFQYPMDLALLATLDPAVAQILGLYWVDETADRDTSYDYMVIADHGYEHRRRLDPLPTKPEPLDPEALPGAIWHHEVDYALAFDVRPGDAGPLDAPTDAEAYPLPPARGRSDVGVRWHQPDDPAGTDSAGTYYLWRSDCGDDPPDAPPDPEEYDVLVRDDADRDDGFVAAAEPIPRTGGADDVPDPLPGWPDERMHAVDTNRRDGWYSYRVSARDLFGRHSPPGEPATWTDADGTTNTHPAADRAVEVAADLPPPPPTGVEGSALDPGDPYVRADDDYEDWRADNENEVGLRVRWLWTEERIEAAPDVERFRLHFQPGRLNAHVGEITAVSSAGDGYRVETNVASDAADDEFAGATLQVGARGFPIVASGGDPLWVEVEPADPTAETAATDGGLLGDDLGENLPDDPFGGGTVDVDDVTITLAPVSAGDECTVSVPAAFSRGTATVSDDVVTAGGAERTVVYGTDTGWSAPLEGQEFRTVDDVETYEVYRVDSPTKLLLDRVYDPPADLPARNRTYAIAHPAGTDYTDVGEWARQLGTVDYDGLTKVDDGTRVYETFVTLSDTTGFEPSVTDPKAFANVSVSAVDAAGQDGPVAAPAKVARVYREPPDPPAIPVIDADFEWASEADYHGTSRYTVRWERPGEGLKTHVFRALDESLFATDWERRQDAIDEGEIEEVTLSADDYDRFPDPLCPDDGDDDATLDSKRKSRETIASELNRLNDVGDLGGEKDAAMAFYRSLRNPENDTDDVEKLKPAMLRVLAGLPGNESAYTQVTVDPLDPGDAPNVAGPDTGPGESHPQGDLCAYVDEFDGRSNNCYVYRTATVDPAGNRSDQREGDGEPMSYPTPGVKAPDVVLPRTPSVTAVEGGDREITLTWASNQEPDLAEYRVYRADDREDARDLRLMAHAGTVVEDLPPRTADGETRPPTRSFTESRPALESFYYRVVAVDDAGNVSTPSPVRAGKAVCDGPPPAPTWTAATWVKVESDGTVHDWASGPADASPAVSLSWDAADGASVTLQRSTDNGFWQSVTSWSDAGEYLDEGVDPSADHAYRLRAKNASGQVATSDTTSPEGGE